MLESLSVGNADFKDVSTSRHMYVESKINNTSLISLIDTGASGLSFISKSMCDSLKLPSSPIQRPISIVGFEGKQGAQITHKASFTLHLGRHCEEISAHIIHPCKNDLVLGLPWLEKHALYRLERTHNHLPRKLSRKVLLSFRDHHTQTYTALPLNRPVKLQPQLLR